MVRKRINKKILIPVARPWLGPSEQRYVGQALASGWISSKGEFIDRLEKKFAAYCGTKHAISVCNGTVALHLALVALGIGPGDEVIVPSLTFIASANAVVYTGAKPVLVDIDPVYWVLDPSKIEAGITRRTKAIMAVHLYGHPADMTSLRRIAKKHNLFLIEDAAEAHGALVNGKMVGSLGDIGIFSFFGNKIITTGEGGMVVTDNPRLAAKMRVLKSHGMDPCRKYWHPVIGYNYRMTNVQAAIGLAQLEKIGKILKIKDWIRAQYDLHLGLLKGVTVQPTAPWARSVCWLYSIQVKNKRTRDMIIEALGRQGIESRPFFYPLEVMPPYKGKVSPVSARVSECGINLPSAVDLTAANIKTIAGIIETTIREANHV